MNSQILLNLIVIDSNIDHCYLDFQTLPFEYLDIANSNIQVIAAAKAANIHNFVAALPAGYETNVNTIIIMRIVLMKIMIMQITLAAK